MNLSWSAVWEGLPLLLEGAMLTVVSAGRRARLSRLHAATLFLMSISLDRLGPRLCRVPSYAMAVVSFRCGAVLHLRV